MTDNLTITLAHCGQPMEWRRGTVKWEGPPGGGFEIGQRDYRCKACNALVTVTSREPA